jgi:hypothetical protein
MLKSPAILARYYFSDLVFPFPHWELVAPRSARMIARDLSELTGCEFVDPHRVFAWVMTPFGGRFYTASSTDYPDRGRDFRCLSRLDFARDQAAYQPVS